jgi:hypothetical protein
MKLTEAQISAMAKNMYQSGEPDNFYQFDKADLWIKEYWITKARHAAVALEEEC